MRLAVEPLQHVSIDQRIYEALAEQIITWELPPGTRITEEAIAQQLGVSRTPVREAIKALAKDDLVEIVPRCGVHVKKLGQQDLAEIYEIRRALEGLAARLAASRMSRADLGELRALAERGAAELAEGSTEACLEFDAQLHARICARAGNRRLETMLGSLNNLIRYFRTRVARIPAYAAQAYAEHCRVLEALGRGDAAGAETAMREHIGNARESILQAIKLSP